MPSHQKADSHEALNPITNGKSDNMNNETTKLFATYLAGTSLLVASPFSFSDEERADANTYQYIGTIKENTAGYIPISMKPVESSWKVTSLDKQWNVSSPDEEILLAKKNGKDGWEFMPYFKYTSYTDRWNKIECDGERPKGFDKKNFSYKRELFTNACNSKFVTTTSPDSTAALIGKGVGFTVVCAMTMGVGCIAGLMGESERYVNYGEIKKAVRDTQLIELLNRYIPAQQAFENRLQEVQNSWTSKALTIRKSFEVTDRSGGLASLFNPSDASYLVSYEAVRLKQPAKNGPLSIDKFDEYVAGLAATIENLRTSPVILIARCPKGISKVNGFNVQIPTCPNKLEVSLSDDEIKLPLIITGISPSIIPSITAKSKVIEAKLTHDGIVITNNSSDFIDVTNVSLSINGKGKVVNKTIAIPPGMTMPRNGERSEFGLNDLVDNEMRSVATFNNLTYSQAQREQISTTLAVRYSVNGRQETAQKAIKAPVLDYIRSGSL